MRSRTVRTAAGSAALSFLVTAIFVAGCTSDPRKPQVASQFPADGGTGIALNSLVSVTFDMDMDAATIDGTSFTVVESVSQNPVAGTVTYDAPSRTASFTPPGNLLATTEYTVTLSSAIRGSNNQSIAPVVFSFTTGAAADSTPPAVTATTPADTATGVALGTDITVTFDEGLDPSTVNDMTVLVTNGGSVQGQVSWDSVNLVATFNPDADLADSTVYTVTVTTGVQDLAGNALLSDVVFSFTTVDTTPPAVNARTPAPGATGLPLNTDVTAIFSEDMDPATIDGTTFTLANGGAVTGTVSYDAPSRTATFSPASNLSANTTYTATLTTGVRDLAGLGLASNVVWTFTTVNDATAPQVAARSPDAGETAVATNRVITVTFDEPMDPATIDGTSFTVVDDAMGALTSNPPVSYDPASMTATFTPSVDMQGLQSHTVTLSAAITDLAGNPLGGAPVVWSFTTDIGPDTTSPSITTFSPSDLDTGVSVATHQEITFSEPMNKATVQSAITVTPSLLHPFEFYWNATGDMVTVVFDTTNPQGVEADDLLVENTTYSVQVASTAEDLAGNPLVAGSADWTTQVDVTPPTIFAVDAGTVDPRTTVVAPSLTQMTVTFSEPMDQSNDTARVDIEADLERDRREASVGFPSSNPDLTVTWSNSTDLLIDFGATPLVANIGYSIRIDALDTAGNRFDGDDNEFFMVVQGSDTGSPSVMSALPENGLTDVPPDSIGFLAFSRAMGPDILSHVSVSGNGATSVEFERTPEPPGIVIIPRAAWPANTDITVTVGSAATDASGNSLGSDFNLTFRAGALNTNTWALNDQYNQLRDGDVDVPVGGFRNTFFFADSAGAPVVVSDQDLSAEDVKLRERDTGIPVKGFTLETEEDGRLEIESDGAVSVQLANNTAYELVFEPTLLNSHGVAITPATIEFTTVDAAGNSRPDFRDPPEIEFEATPLPGGRAIDVRVRVEDVDADPLTVDISDDGGTFAEVLTETPPGSGEYQYTSSADETDFSTVGAHTLTTTANDGQGHAVTIKRDIWNFGLSDLPTVTSPGGGASVPGGVPTYSFNVPSNTLMDTHVIFLVVEDDTTGETVLFVPISAEGGTSKTFNHPADSPLPAGTYGWTVGAARFNTGVPRGDFAGTAIASGDLFQVP